MPWEKQFDKDEVLSKAMLAFWRHGYEATSMQDLVDCTGINRGSLYATFGDKRALFLASLHMYDDGLRRRMLSELEQGFAPIEAIRRLFLAFVEAAPPLDGNKGCFLTNTALELAQHDKEVGQIVARSQEDIEAFFARIVKKGKVAGDIPAHVKPNEAARGLLASFLGLIVLTRSRPEKTLLKAIAEEALHRLA